MEFVKFVILDVLNVLVLQEIVLHAPLEGTYTMLPVGIIAQASLIVMENALVNVHQDIGEFLINNANLVLQNVKHAVAILLA
jgi:hypothetical protein